MEVEEKRNGSEKGEERLLTKVPLLAASPPRHIQKRNSPKAIYVLLLSSSSGPKTCLLYVLSVYLDGLTFDFPLDGF